MKPFFLTSTALNELKAIWRYIALDSLQHADLVEAAIYATCRLAGHQPLAGHLRPEITIRPVRFLTVTDYRNYCIAYSNTTQAVRVIHIFHGAQDVPKLFR